MSLNDIIPLLKFQGQHVLCNSMNCSWKVLTIKNKAKFAETHTQTHIRARTHTQRGSLPHHGGSIGHPERGLLSPVCDVAAVLLHLLQQLPHWLAVIGHFAFLQERFQLQGYKQSESVRKRDKSGRKCPIWPQDACRNFP